MDEMETGLILNSDSVFVVNVNGRRRERYIASFIDESTGFCGQDIRFKRIGDIFDLSELNVDWNTCIISRKWAEFNDNTFNFIGRRDVFEKNFIIVVDPHSSFLRKDLKG